MCYLPVSKFYCIEEIQPNFSDPIGYLSIAVSINYVVSCCHFNTMVVSLVKAP